MAPSPRLRPSGGHHKASWAETPSPVPLGHRPWVDGRSAPRTGRCADRCGRPGTTTYPRSVAPTPIRSPAVQDESAPTTVDLFCGGGGLSLGFMATGFRTALASDMWGPAARTIGANFGDHAPFLHADARDLTRNDVLVKAGLDAAPDVVMGGPPCQGFSSAGVRRDSDPRNTLVGTFAELVAEIRPRAFVFENVEGFLTAADGRYVMALLDPVIEAGYSVHVRKLNVANFGVPQFRKRVLAVGVLQGGIEFPAPTHFARGAPGTARVGSYQLPPTPTMAEALADLPTAAKSSPGYPTDHYERRIGAEDLRRILSLLPGSTMRDLPIEMQHASYQRRANRRVSDGTPSERRGGAPAGLRRLRADEPAKAITSAASREFIHPSYDRPLTLRECARLQTFPDSFEFHGTQSDKATLIGNAVPPVFAAVIAGVVMASRGSGASGHPDTSGSGRLLSFSSTVAEGMSPALGAVTELVTRRYGLDTIGTLWERL